MAYDEGLAERIRTAIGDLADHREIRMFGGLCWTVNTHMAVGIIDDDLIVAVGTDGVDDALARGARQSYMGERPMGGMVKVGLADLPDRESLDAWVAPAVDRALARPPKPPRKKK